MTGIEMNGHAYAKLQVALKPCPFCASTNIDPEGWCGYDTDTNQMRKGPACDDCGASAESISRWNTRP